MEPRIQYAKTSDGVSIAFWAIGEGLPLIQMPWLPWSHLQLEWQIPEFRRWYERLAERVTLVRYDGRGAGLSTRTVSHYSLDACLLDLDAVVDSLGSETFGLLGPVTAASVAIAYAARYPQRVSHLILWCPFARDPEVVDRSPQLRALVALRDQDWGTYTETVAHVATGWSGGEKARDFADYMRQSVSQEVARTYLASRQVDVSHLLPQVKSPTLVLQRRQAPFPDVGRARAHHPRGSTLSRRLRGEDDG